jgi:AcrR family transcriptional regulator
VLSQGDRIVAAATDLFLSNGYSGMSIDALISSVGGSRRDLYRVIGSKEELFRRVVEEACEERQCHLEAILPAIDGSPESLRVTAKTFIHFLIEPRSVALARLLITEAERMPEVAGTFLKLGPQVGYKMVSEILVTCAAEQGRTWRNPELAGRLFLDAVIGSMPLRVRTGETITEEEIDEVADTAVSIFLSL